LSISDTPQHFHIGNMIEFNCFNDHTIKEHPSRADTGGRILQFKGHCSGCKDIWDDFVDDGGVTPDGWKGLIDSNFPNDPSFIELRVQRIIDWKRKQGKSVDNYKLTTADFDGLVTWVSNKRF